MVKLCRTSSALLFAWIFLSCINFRVVAQNPDHFPTLEFKNGERVVFLGGSFFENELEDSYLEFAIASRWADRDLTFRNLGWTGDNVFAEARSTFTTPPTPYQQLFQQIRSTRPDYLLIAYGTVEAQKGEAGLAEFTRGLEVLIDSADALGAQTILLSTIPVKLAGSAENTVRQNRNLKIYSDAIAAIASKRRKRFVDLYTPVTQFKNDTYAHNGIHLNDKGYHHVALLLEEAFGWPDRGELFVIDARTVKSATGNQRISGVSRDGEKLTFQLQEEYLPLPQPATPPSKPTLEQTSAASVKIQITGLAPGRYSLSEEGNELRTASAEEWAKGLTLHSPTSQAQSARIADSISKKNMLFFQQYRPMNRTYILGFREYEQGRHKEGLKEMDKFIGQLEDHIRKNSTPVKKSYELSPVK